jgi:hypothetical protein
MSSSCDPEPSQHGEANIILVMNLIAAKVSTRKR